MKYQLTNVTTDPITILGVTLEGGETRNLLEDGVYLEDIARSDKITEKIISGELVGPPQANPIDQASAGLQLEPGDIVMISPETSSSFALSLPPAAVASQVPFPIYVFNRSVHTITIETSGSDTGIPDSSIFDVVAGDSLEFWSTKQDEESWAWVVK